MELWRKEEVLFLERTKPMLTVSWSDMSQETYKTETCWIKSRRANLLKELSKCNKAISNLTRSQNVNQLYSITCSRLNINRSITWTHNVKKGILGSLTAVFNIVQCEFSTLSATLHLRGKVRTGPGVSFSHLSIIATCVRLFNLFLTGGVSWIRLHLKSQNY